MTMDAQYLPTVEALYQDYFARQVEARPDAIGVCSPGISLTYAELDALSSSLANFLIGQGVGPNEVVPLCFENSPWAVISMLSVVKAGGAFTFLDATYPRSRLEDVVRNVGAKFLLVSPSLAGSSCLKDLLPTSFIISGDSIHNLPASSEVFPTPPNTLTSPESLLYIIFTSGSTGKPKGVCIPHSSYLSSALHQRSVCNLVPNSRVLQFAKYTFDISILETLTTLISGGCICIPDEEARGRGLEHVMNDFQITWSVMTVSLSRVIDPVEVPSLKTLLLGGEPLAQTDLKRWAGHVQLMNVSGNGLFFPAVGKSSTVLRLSLPSIPPSVELTIAFHPGIRPNGSQHPSCGQSNSKRGRLRCEHWLASRRAVVGRGRGRCQSACPRWSYRRAGHRGTVPRQRVPE